MKKTGFAVRLMLAVVTLAALGTAAQGQTYRRWDGSASTAYNDANNWTAADVPNTPSEAIDVDGDNGTRTEIQWANYSYTVGQLRIGSPATTTRLYGVYNAAGTRTLTLTPTSFGDIGLDMSAATVDFSIVSWNATRRLVPTLGSDQQWNVTSSAAAGDLILLKGLQDANAPMQNINLQGYALTANVGSGRSIDATYGLFQGTGGSIILTGAGTLKLGQANTYTGLTEVQGGTLVYGVANAISTGGVTVNGSSAILDIKTFSDSVGTVTLQGGGQINGTTGVLTGSSYDVRSGSVSAILGGSGVALTKSTSDTVTLSGVNTYSGLTDVQLGTLLATKATSLGSGARTVSGGTLATRIGTGGWTTAQVDTLWSGATKTSGNWGIDTTTSGLTQWTPFSSGGNFGTSLGLVK
ncbi:MAG: autotransporter-associated beta strand repeat-containing protein, partial [Kiritimatiellaeota bacterium]|nr:autotransporter-associated beta strand repeat-containing protein [Kiritimatiellota bacterium]